MYYQGHLDTDSFFFFFTYYGYSLPGGLSQGVEAREFLAKTGHIGHCLREVLYPWLIN